MTRYNGYMMRFTLMLVGLAAMLVACGGGIDSAVPVSFVDICAEDDRWITADGVLALGDITNCETIGDLEQCHIQVINPDDATQSVTATIEVGAGVNQMSAIPDNYTDSDLLVRDTTGTVLGVGHRVRLTGTASNNEAAYACRVWVRRIEALP